MAYCLELEGSHFEQLGTSVLNDLISSTLPTLLLLFYYKIRSLDKFLFYFHLYFTVSIVVSYY